LIIIGLAIVVAAALAVMGKKIKETVEARQRAKEEAMRQAADAAKDTNIMMGVLRGFIDPLGIVI
jgi:hypothetical protein